MNNQVARLVQALCEDIGTPRALSIAICLRYGDLTELQRFRCEPNRYECPEMFFQDNLVTELLRKCDLPSDVDKVGVARQTFLECERENCRTNARLNHWLPSSQLLVDSNDWRILDFIEDWRKEVREVLGGLPMQLTPQFSAGATFYDRGQKTTIPHKMTSQASIYSHSTHLADYVYQTQWGRAIMARRKSAFRTVRGNRFETVPKDAEKHRGICVESSVNVALQLNVGSIIRQRLRRLGIDLNEGQHHHREMAQWASLSGDFATIDLSNASDTLCYNLVKLVLPDGWFQLLESLRAPLTRVGKSWYKLEKFSSMGNGFTFELETLIFATLCRTVIKSEGRDPSTVMVYGDDMIVPTGHYRSIVAALRLFGFQPNVRKSYAVGLFRESCGGDFHSGVPVRAHYVKELPMEPQQWISLANGLRRSCAGVPGRWEKVLRAWHIALSQLPKDIRENRGPTHLGDIVIHDDESKWRVRVFDKSCQTRVVRAWTPVAERLSWRLFPSLVQLASCTLGLSSSGPSPRGAISGYKHRYVPCDLTSHWVPS